MKIIYYMPIFLKEQAKKTNNKQLLDFCEIFKVVNSNACLIDRTHNGILNTPFEYKCLFDIPSRPVTPNNTSFEILCLERAKEILQKNKFINIFYSGGIDSTCVVLSFYLAVLSGHGSFDQIIVSTTPIAIIENPEFWHKIIIPNFKINSVNSSIEDMSSQSTISDRYVMGENADQLFGSDILLTNFHLFNEKILEENVVKFLNNRNIEKESFSKIAEMFLKLKESCPIELNTMADIVWWLNFSCKWQSVSLRFLCFSNFLDVVKYENDLEKFETFFNTEQFQMLSIYGNLEKWGHTPSVYNYKLSARHFLKTLPCLRDYADNKIKVPSLYRVLTSETYKYNALGVEDGKIFKVDEIITKI